MMGDIRIRMVEYSANYLADHWCSKGHIIFCIEGAMETELQDGRKFLLEKGMTYYVGDNCEAHRSASVKGCKLFIVD
jgi:quercetin dioxygenase-like cupin family protein